MSDNLRGIDLSWDSEDSLTQMEIKDNGVELFLTKEELDVPIKTLIDLIRIEGDLIFKVDSYRDGGTLELTFADGLKMFIDNRIGTKTSGYTYPKHPSDCEPLPQQEVVKNYILSVLDSQPPIIQHNVNQTEHIKKLLKGGDR